MNIRPVGGSNEKRHGFRSPVAQISVRTVLALKVRPLWDVAPINGLSGGIAYVPACTAEGYVVELCECGFGDKLPAFESTSRRRIAEKKSLLMNRALSY